MKRAGVIVVVSVLGGACTIMNGYELPAAVNGADSGASSSSGKSQSSSTSSSGQPTKGDGGPGCVLNHPPPQPAPAGGTDMPTPIELAVGSMEDTNNGAPLGYDLDNLCTCFGTPPDPPPCITKGQTVCDLNGNGTDNAGNGISKGLTGVFNPVTNANQRILEGQTGFLIRVADYTGSSNDEAVTVTTFRSNGVADGEVNLSEKQSWPASARTSVSTTAWVNNFTLVANFDSVEVPFLDGIQNPATIQHAMIVGQIVPSGGNGPTMTSALVVGRTSTNDIIASIGQLEVFNGSGAYVCQQNQQYAAFGSATCLIEDINLDPNADKAGTATCDALSIVVSMNLVAATITAPEAIDQASNHCDGQPTIQCN